jgi:predicted hotdog family 3-hydroxylacyl-ACP dehydratase
MQAPGTADSIALQRLVPHAGAMLLLSGVLRHDAVETACSVEIAEQQLFRDADGSVPVWIGLEYMAQCIAVHAALSNQREGPPPIGFLVSARGLRFYCSRFEAGQRLEAVASRISVGSSGLSSFACSLRDRSSGALLAEGRIGCFVPPIGAHGGSA